MSGQNQNHVIYLARIVQLMQYFPDHFIFRFAVL